MWGSRDVRSYLQAAAFPRRLEEKLDAASKQQLGGFQTMMLPSSSCVGFQEKLEAQSLTSEVASPESSTPPTHRKGSGEKGHSGGKSSPRIRQSKSSGHVRSETKSLSSLGKVCCSHACSLCHALSEES